MDTSRAIGKNMRRFYHRIITGLCNLYYWWIDYMYVCYWQINGAFLRFDVKQYLMSGDAKRDPVILIPGVYEKWHFMKPIADLVHKQGHAIHIIDALGYNRGTVEDMAHIVERYVQAHQLESYIVIAHSKGGLIAKYMLMNPQCKMRKAITINTPFGGSRYAGLFLAKSIRIFLINSPIMKLLSADTLSNKQIISIYGIFDPHIPGGSYLDGATNIQVSARGHFRIMNDPLIHRAIIQSIK
jgi:triacylglycerol lipase